MQVPADRNDPQVKLPAAIRAAAERADSLQKEFSGKPQDPPAATPPEATPPAATSGGTEPPVTPAGNQPPEGDWEHKYKSMKGRYDTLAKDFRGMSDQVSNLQSVIATMQATTPQDPPAAPARGEKLVTPKDQEDYGQDLISLVGRAAREELSPEVVLLKHEIASLKQQLGNVGQSITMSDRNTMLSALDERLPNWREININEEFLRWLALPDAYSGAIRMELLKQAYGRNETARVLRFFEGFLAEEAARAPAPTDQNTGNSPGGNPPAPPNPGKVPLESLAAPGRARSAAGSPPPAEKPYFTRSQIAAFYADVNRGVYRGRDEDKALKEASIFAAQREGRIR